MPNSFFIRGRIKNFQIKFAARYVLVTVFMQWSVYMSELTNKFGSGEAQISTRLQDVWLFEIWVGSVKICFSSY